jgi:hypothetical protein
MLIERREILNENNNETNEDNFLGDNVVNWAYVDSEFYCGGHECGGYGEHHKGAEECHR